MAQAKKKAKPAEEKPKAAEVRAKEERPKRKFCSWRQRRCLS